MSAIPISSPTNVDVGINAVWDFTNLAIEKDSFNIQFRQKDATTIDCHFPHEHYYILNSGDTVLMSGYENASVSELYSYPERIYRLPIVYGDSMTNDFIVQGEYSHTISFSTMCHSESQVEGLGRLMLPEAIIDSVYCVHSTRFFRRKDAVDLENQLYLWIPKDSVMPIMVYSSYTRLDSMISSDAYLLGNYYSESSNSPLVMNMPSNQDDDQAGEVISAASFLPNPVVSDLCIRYTLSQPSTVYYSVHYEGGQIVYSTPSIYESAGEHEFILNMGSLPRATYVVYIHAENAVSSGVVLKL